MSSGFSGSITRTMNVNKEVETRMKRLDVFYDEFNAKSDATQEMDDLDHREYIRGATIKKPSDQFPTKDPIDGVTAGTKLSASDNAKHDIHQTDPARLKREVRLAFGREQAINYKGHKIAAVPQIDFYHLHIDQSKQDGNFLSPASALERGKVLVDRSERSNREKFP